MPVYTLQLRPDLTHYDFSVQLDEIRYRMELRWSVREESWYMTIKTADGETDIVTGVKVVLEWPLGVRSASEDRWAGMIMAFDSSGQKEMPGLLDMGDRVILSYSDRADMVEILEG